MSAQAVFFDYGGTLDSNGISWVDRFYPLYLDQGFKITRDEFARAFYASDDGLARRHDLRGLGLEETIALQVRCVLEILSPRKKRADETVAITKTFVSDSRRSLCRAKPFLERLRLKYRLGIISNFYGNLAHILNTEGFQGLFEVVADSGAVGHLKPSPELFEFAIDRVGADSAEAWMVGDSIARDMKGAEGVAMPHAWLKGIRADATPPCCGDARVLSALTDLERFLEGVPAAL